jgi:hypothetical protein
MLYHVVFDQPPHLERGRAGRHRHDRDLRHWLEEAP